MFSRKKCRSQEKSNEIRALPALLEMLDLEGALVTADALHTQRAASELIIGKGGNYVLTLKANQRELHKDAKEWLEDPEAQKEMLSCRHVGCGHGRIETRTATVSHDVGWLQDLHRWPGLEAVGKVEAARETETRTCIRWERTICGTGWDTARRTSRPSGKSLRTSSASWTTSSRSGGGSDGRRKCRNIDSSSSDARQCSRESFEVLLRCRPSPRSATGTQYHS